MIAAEYARSLVKDGTGQLDELEKKIREACLKGKYSVTLDWFLNCSVVKILEKQGFLINEGFVGDSFIATISWKPQKGFAL